MMSPVTGSRENGPLMGSSPCEWLSRTLLYVTSTTARCSQNAIDAQSRRPGESTVNASLTVPGSVTTTSPRGQGDEVQAKEVAIALLPDIADTCLVGRQTVINRVSQVMRAMVAAGQLEQVRPENNDAGRKTCRYKLAREEERDAR
jgi:hypothetical protein